MKQNILCATFWLALSATLICGCSQKGQDGDLVLHYDQPASFFEEALPLGNGKIGAMVYGGTSTDKLSLNDITLGLESRTREEITLIIQTFKHSLHGERHLRGSMI